MRYLYLFIAVVLIGFCSCEKKASKTEEDVSPPSFTNTSSRTNEIVSRPRFNDTSFYDVIGSKAGDYALIKVINYSNRITGVGLVNINTLAPIGEWFYLSNEGGISDFLFFDKQGSDKLSSYEYEPPSVFFDSIGTSIDGISMLFFSSIYRGDGKKRKIKLRLIYEYEERTDSLEFKTLMHPFINVELKGKLPSHIQFQSEEDVPDTVYSYPAQRAFQLDTIKRVKQPKKLLELYSKAFKLEEAGVSIK